MIDMKREIIMDIQEVMIRDTQKDMMQVMMIEHRKMNNNGSSKDER